MGPNSLEGLHRAVVGPHRCAEMDSHLGDGELAIRYIAFAREYAIDYRSSPDSIQLIHFCPWCGAKLPADLRERWGNELDKLGLLDPFGDDREAVPAEFWTEAWWRERDL